MQTGALNELGELLVAAGRAPEAEEYLREALTRSTEAGERYEQGRALLGLAQVHTRAGSMLEAERDTARASALMHELGIGRSVPPHG